MTCTQLCALNYTQLLWWKVAIILIGHLRPIGCKWMNSCMENKTNKACEKLQHFQ